MEGISSKKIIRDKKIVKIYKLGFRSKFLKTRFFFCFNTNVLINLLLERLSLYTFLRSKFIVVKVNFVIHMRCNFLIEKEEN